ncbi:hypothetical protein [Paraburkholderia fungorum]|uniref:hypothetical protein n=1 Tax=Paraburkholderia fungorum TaxID=134537 RepID=UPI000DB797DD|nr:hypothetical protein [Paraburkholderia fungorum]PZR42320.1 MAG: hypothetical protein DI523_31255 [Paraburkholderia fungorum]
MHTELSTMLVRRNPDVFAWHPAWLCVGLLVELRFSIDWNKFIRRISWIPDSIICLCWSYAADAPGSARADCTRMMRQLADLSLFLIAVSDCGRADDVVLSTHARNCFTAAFAAAKV